MRCCKDCGTRLIPENTRVYLSKNKKSLELRPRCRSCDNKHQYNNLINRGWVPKYRKYKHPLIGKSLCRYCHNHLTQENIPSGVAIPSICKTCYSIEFANKKWARVRARGGMKRNPRGSDPRVKRELHQLYNMLFHGVNYRKTVIKNDYKFADIPLHELPEDFLEAKFFYRELRREITKWPTKNAQ